MGQSAAKRVGQESESRPDQIEKREGREMSDLRDVLSST